MQGLSGRCLALIVNADESGGRSHRATRIDEKIREFRLMTTAMNQRFKSGETCRETGTYEFDGFTDGTTNPKPTPDEREVTVTAGDKFPMPGNPKKSCYWRAADGSSGDDSSSDDEMAPKSRVVPSPPGAKSDPSGPSARSHPPQQGPGVRSGSTRGNSGANQPDDGA